MRPICAIFLAATLLLYACCQVECLNLIITELVDPQADTTKRYVELYSDDGAGQTITESLSLLRFTNAKTASQGSVISLTGLTIDQNGFLLVCKSGVDFSCEKTAGAGGAADSNGDDKIAIVRDFVNSSSYTIVDIYGTPGEDSATAGYDFEDARAYRKTDVTVAKATFNKDDWIIENTNADPRAWAAPGPTTPSPTPTPLTCGTTIKQVQGSSDVSPLLGDRVRVCTGYVTQIISNGFFMQEPNPVLGTSSGIFVYTGSDPTVTYPTMEVGHSVEVEGEASEFKSATQISAVNAADIVVNANIAKVSFTPVDLSFPVPSDIFEQYEGMLVNIRPATNNKIVISEYYELDRYGTTIVCAAPETDGRIAQYTQVNPPSTAGFASWQDLRSRSCLTIDDNLFIQNPSPVKIGSIYAVDSTNSNIGGAEVTTLKGPLYKNSGVFSGKYWQVSTKEAGDLVFSLPTREAIPTFEEEYDVKIAVTNVLNYFTTFNVRGANNQAEFDRQAQKTSLALSQMNADILGVVEVENQANNEAVKDLVQRINALLPARNYVAATVEASQNTVGGDAIKCDVIFDSNRFTMAGFATLTDSEVDPTILSQANNGDIFNGRSRVPVAVSLQSKQNGEYVTVVVNHFKSKGDRSGNAPGLDADQSDGAGAYNQVRYLSSQALVQWLGTNPTGVDTDNVLIVGDLNAYEQEQPIQYLKDNGYQTVGDNSGTQFTYSFLFDGAWGSLDYIFVKNEASSKVLDAKIWHCNSEEADLIDYNTDFGRDQAIFDGSIPYRFSDHDPKIVTMKLKAADPNCFDNTPSCLVSTSGKQLECSMLNENYCSQQIVKNACPDLCGTCSAEVCADRVPSNLIYRAGSMAGCHAPCSDLTRYCSSIPIVAERCPETCNTACAGRILAADSLSVVSLPSFVRAPASAVSARVTVPGEEDDDVGGEENKDKVSLIIAGSVFGLLVVASAIVILTKRRGGAQKKMKEAKLSANNKQSLAPPPGLSNSTVTSSNTSIKNPVFVDF